VLPFAPTGDGLYCKVQGLPQGYPYLGRPPEKRLAGARYLGRAIDWKHPWENPEHGCPGAWYRTPFIDSAYRYYRRQTRHGPRAQSPMFDAADWQTQRAILYLEDEEDRCANYYDSVAAERHRKEAEEMSKTNQDRPGPRRRGRR
jgi:hypothetical protein